MTAPPNNSCPWRCFPGPNRILLRLFALSISTPLHQAKSYSRHSFQYVLTSPLSTLFTELSIGSQDFIGELPHCLLDSSVGVLEVWGFKVGREPSRFSIRYLFISLMYVSSADRSETYSGQLSCHLRVDLLRLTFDLTDSELLVLGFLEDFGSM